MLFGSATSAQIAKSDFLSARSWPADWLKGKRLSARVRREDPDIKNLCEDLTHRLGSKVKIVQTKKGGGLEIRYCSVQNLERVIRLLRADEKGSGSGGSKVQGSEIQR